MAGASPLQIPTDFTDQQVMDGLRQPTGMAFLPDGRLLVVEQAGGVRMIVEGKLGAIDPVLTVDSVLVSPEQGLTGIAVDPRWPSRPYVYLYYDALELKCRITRFKAMGDLTAPTSGVLWLDPASKYEVILPTLKSRVEEMDKPAGVGIDHMASARIGARRRNREVIRLDDLGDASRLQRMLDANAPAQLGHGPSVYAHVAGCIERASVGTRRLCAVVRWPDHRCRGLH